MRALSICVRNWSCTEHTHQELKAGSVVYKEKNCSLLRVSSTPIMQCILSPWSITRVIDTCKKMLTGVNKTLKPIMAILFVDTDEGEKPENRFERIF
jgi:hypothetical protein